MDNGKECNWFIYSTDEQVSGYRNTPPLPIPANGCKNGERIVKEINNVEFAFLWCPCGQFKMGSPKSEKGRNNDEIQHDVILTKGFWVMETEVTQKQWKAIMGKTIQDQATLNSVSHDLFGVGDSYPMYDINWYDCQEFCKKCQELGFPFKLPTEAQWEYACRASTTGPFAGDSVEKMAWFNGNSSGNSHPVATKKSNPWGIYDMHGNVWEWCSDLVDKHFQDNVPQDEVIDPVGPSKGINSNRIIRGGTWCDSSDRCRSAERDSQPAANRLHTIGARFIIQN